MLKGVIAPGLFNSYPGTINGIDVVILQKQQKRTPNCEENTLKKEPHHIFRMIFSIHAKHKCEYYRVRCVRVFMWMTSEQRKKNHKEYNRIGSCCVCGMVWCGAVLVGVFHFSLLLFITHCYCYHFNSVATTKQNSIKCKNKNENEGKIQLSKQVRYQNFRFVYLKNSEWHFFVLLF